VNSPKYLHSKNTKFINVSACTVDNRIMVLGSLNIISYEKWVSVTMAWHDKSSDCGWRRLPPYQLASCKYID
jgi:hypothetical protein